MLETQVHSLGQADALEKEMANHSSTLAAVHGVAESDTTERLHFHFHFIIGRDIRGFLTMK